MQETLGNIVHIVVDKQPSNKFVNTFTDPFGNINVMYNGIHLSYSDHQKIFMYGESVNYEKIINFQDVMIELLKKHTYDYIVVNSQEAFAALSSFNIPSKIILYTHLYKQIYPDANVHDVFLPAYHRFYGQFLQLDHITVGTQSIRNKERLMEQGCKNVEILPMPMSERNLLIEGTKEKSGVLFIGRWEAGKNPEAYIKAMKQTKLPCKVMTNENGKKKFEKAFSEAGITDYEIRAGITGNEKTDFIKSCKVSFNTSLIENYPFAFIECVGHMPVITLDKQDWSDNFDTKYYVKLPENLVADAISDAYDITDWYSTGALDYVKQLDQNATNAWQQL
jgi:glycosyltransferase involved in cell wall biosynthesis